MGKAYAWRRLGKDVGEVVASSSSLSAAARRLGVDRSTLHRWLKAGKVQGAAARQKRATTAEDGPATNRTPGEWAAAVRRDYEFTATEERLVDLSELTLTMSQDERLSTSERLAAMARFQALTKQLRLEDAVDGEEEKTARGVVRPWPRRVSAGE